MFLNSNRQWDGNVVTRSLLRNQVVGLSQVGRIGKSVEHSCGSEPCRSKGESKHPTRKEEIKCRKQLRFGTLPCSKGDAGFPNQERSRLDVEQGRANT